MRDDPSTDSIVPTGWRALAAVAVAVLLVLGVGLLARSYAPAVATVVAGTGNHYVLDAVAGAGLGVVARRLVGEPGAEGR